MTAVDLYAGAGDDLLSPASRAAAVVPSDTDALPYASKGLWVGGAGTVNILTVGGSTVAYECPAGVRLKVRAAQVFATGTSATDILAEF